MAQSVLLVLPDNRDRKTLVKLFEKRGLDVVTAESPGKVEALAKKNKFNPALAVIDLHLTADTWLECLNVVKRHSPETSILISTDRSDPSLVLRAKTLGAKNFLRTPFDEEGLQHALKRMGTNTKNGRNSIRERLPTIRTPIRVKIILPYVVMAIIIGFGAAFVINDNTRNSEKERIINQLIGAGRISSDWIVREEERMLTSLRLISNTQGMSTEILNEEIERLRELSLPIALNNSENIVVILDANGRELLGIRRISDSGEMSYSSGGEVFAALPFVQSIITSDFESAGDKYSGLANIDSSTFFFVSGSVRDDQGNITGVVLVGNSTSEIVKQMQQDTLAQISLFDTSGNLLASTFNGNSNNRNSLQESDASNIISRTQDESAISSFIYSGEEYQEILSAWMARGDQNIGIIGTAQPEAFFAIDSGTTTAQIFLLLTGAFILVILLGLFVAGRISNPLMQVVEASTEVARGNFDVRIPIKGDDEISILAHSFNRMVVGLKDGMLYRSLLGRTVSPEVRDQLRSNLANGDLQIQGQFAIATILMADIHDFTTMSEKENPATVMNWLNELFAELVPIITSYDGVVNEISGDSLFSFFGILPQPLVAAESSYLACQAGLEMIKAVERINWRRAERGDSPLTIGIGINTGPVIAGGLGSQDRLHYTVIGDAVNTTARIEGLAHQFRDSAVMISKETMVSMWDKKDEFYIESRGTVNVKGKVEELEVFRLWPDTEKVRGSNEFDLMPASR